MHLLPELFWQNTTENIGLYILAGFLIQILLEYFSQGIEHGHFHKGNIIPFSVLLSLCLHALFEGIPLAGHLHDHAHNSLLYGIVLHSASVRVSWRNNLKSHLLVTNIIKSEVWVGRPVSAQKNTLF